MTTTNQNKLKKDFRHQSRKKNMMADNEIKMKIHEESDLFSPWDPDQDFVSEEVKFHFDQILQTMRIKKKKNYIIHIFSDTPVDEERVKRKIREFLCRERDITKLGLRSLLIKELGFGIFGVIVLTLWLYLSARTENLSVEILSIISWVAIWEATTIAIMDHPALHRINKDYQHLIDSEILISYTSDAPKKSK